MASMVWMRRAEMFTVSQTNWRKLCRESGSMFYSDITCGQCSTSYTLGKVHRWARLWGKTQEESESQRKVKIVMGTGNPVERRKRAVWRHAKALHHNLWANEHGRVELMRRRRQPRPTHTLSYAQSSHSHCKSMSPRPFSLRGKPRESHIFNAAFQQKLHVSDRNY